MSIDSSHSEVAILSRIVGRVAASMSAEAARAILAIDFASDDQERMRQLATKTADGTLSPTERTELECYNRVGYILSVLHAHARHVLSKKGA
jgi:hypothetical protein